MNFLNFAKFATLFCVLININLIKCDRTIQSTVKEHLYDLSKDLEESFNLQIDSALHPTIAVFGNEYHFYANGQVLKGEMGVFGNPVEVIEHESTKLTELEFDGFLNEIEKPENIKILQESPYWHEEFGSYQIALAFLKPGVGDENIDNSNSLF